MATQRERWECVPGYEDYYEVSDQGRVRRILPNNKTRLLRRRIHLKYGYARVSLSVHSKVRDFRVARLVLMAFVGPCPEGKEADHKNRIRHDDRLSNLRWLEEGKNRSNPGRTAPKNPAKGKRHGFYLHPECRPRAERHGRAKLSWRRVMQIRRARAAGWTYVRIQRALSVRGIEISIGQLYRVAKGAQWRSQ